VLKTLAALERGESAQEPQRILLAVRTSALRGDRGGNRGTRLGTLLGSLSGCEEKLELAKTSTVLGMEQAESADAVKALGRHVLQEAAEELVDRQGHGLVLPVATVAVSERDVPVVVVGGEQRLA
jgi:hypothetical protein